MIKIKKHIIKICWLYILLCLIAGAVILIKGCGFLGRAPHIFFALFFFGSLFWVYAVMRTVKFNNKLAGFLRHLLANEYETGIEIEPIFNDEVTEVSELANKTADRLRIYNKLQLERISFNNRVIDIISRNVLDAFILFDAEKKSFQFNPAARGIFGIERENLTFDSIEKQEKNEDFIKILRDVIEKDKITKEAMVVLQLPIVNNIERRLNIKIIPVKNNEEKVELALILLSL